MPVWRCWGVQFGPGVTGSLEAERRRSASKLQKFDFRPLRGRPGLGRSCRPGCHHVLDYMRAVESGIGNSGAIRALNENAQFIAKGIT